MLTTARAMARVLGIALTVNCVQAARNPVHASAARVQAAASDKQASGSSRTSVPPQRALVDKYCVSCHNKTRKTGGLVLETLDLEHVADAAPVWEKVARKLHAAAMPPPGLPRPDKATLDGFVSSLENALDRAAADSPQPGRPAIHRLNRAEYTNVIRDLLALEVDGRSLLPSDDSSYGFDNIADVLSLSPTLLERYMSAAQK